MLEVYKLINKKFLANLLFMVALLPVMVMMACLFDVNPLLIDTMIYALSMIVAFGAIISIAASNALFYKENMNWLLFLPVSRKKYYQSHATYILVQILEVTVSVSVSFFISGYIIKMKYPEFKNIWQQAKGTAGYSFIDLISLSTHDLTLLALAILLVFGFFFSIMDGQKMRDRFHYLKGFNKETLTIYGMAFLLIVVSFALKGLPLIMIATFGIVFLVWSILAQHILTFRLKIPNWMRPSLYYPATAFMLFFFLFSVSRVHISNSHFSKSVVDDYLFLGSFAPNINEKDFYKSLKADGVRLNSIEELKKLYTRGKDNHDPITMEGFDYVGLVLGKNNILNAYSILKLLNPDKLTPQQTQDLIVHFKKISSVENKKKKICEDCYEMAVRHLTKGEISFEKISFLLKSDLVDIDAKKYVLEKSIFSERPKEILEIVMQNQAIIEHDLSRSLQIISLLQMRKANVFNLASNTKRNRSISSINSDEDCSKLGISTLSDITSDNLGQAVFCSNRAFIKNYKKSNKFKPIRSWPKFPIDKKVGNILANNLILGK